MVGVMENLRKETAQVIIGEENQTKTLDAVDVSTDGKIDFKKVPTVYFKNIKKGNYTIKHTIAKIFIEGCTDLTVTAAEGSSILSSTIEIWRCENVAVNLATQVKTVQLDITKGAKFAYQKKDQFGCVVWQGVSDNIDITFGDDEKSDFSTSFEKANTQWPGSTLEVDQFMIRFVEELGEGLQQERCVRLKNGFLSTDREADAWDKRNTLAKDRYMENFLKESGIKLNKSSGKKIQPNAPCPCGSTKKYKKCCKDKKGPQTGVMPRKTE